MSSDSRSRGLAVVAGVCVALTAAGIWASSQQGNWTINPRWFLWAPLVAGVELLPVPTWRGLTLSVGFPLLMMIAILYPPEVAGVIAFVGASDPRELKREVALSTALFNRSQVALAVMAAGYVFHLFQEPLVDLMLTATWVLILAACLAAVADYVVNAGLVATFMGIKLRVPFGKMIRQLTIGSGREFVVSYLGLGILGLTLAVFYQKVGLWMLPAVLAPLMFARQMFFRTRALEEAHVELQEREEILRELSNTMAEERADERHGGRADEAELLADDGEDHVRVRLGQVVDLLDAVAEPLADEAARAHADHRLHALEAGALSVLPRVEEAEEARAPVRLDPDRDRARA